MKKMIVLLVVAFLAGCAAGVDGAPPIEHAPPLVPSGIVVEIDPSRFVDVEVDARIDGPVRAALAEWSAKTGILFRISTTSVEPRTYQEGTFRFSVGPARPYVAQTSGDPSTRAINIAFDPEVAAENGVDQNLLRVVMLHEVGHAFGLTFEGPDGHDDPHYWGGGNSVMWRGLNLAAWTLQEPELAAFRAHVSPSRSGTVEE